MNTSLSKVGLYLSLLLTSLVVTAGDSEQQIIQAGTQISSIGSPQFFTGLVTVEPLFPRMNEINASGAYVTFEPLARSAWHTHPKGQHIIVTKGLGLTQEWGKPIKQLKPGDVVWCPPGVKHWHGAASGTSMTHLVVTGYGNEGDNVKWLEKVTDSQYEGTPSSAGTNQ